MASRGLESVKDIVNKEFPPEISLLQPLSKALSQKGDDGRPKYAAGDIINRKTGDILGPVDIIALRRRTRYVVLGEGFKWDYVCFDAKDPKLDGLSLKPVYNDEGKKVEDADVDVSEVWDVVVNRMFDLPHQVAFKGASIRAHYAMGDYLNKAGKDIYATEFTLSAVKQAKNSNFRFDVVVKGEVKGEDLKKAAAAFDVVNGINDEVPF